jgi:hypothetical protein
VGVDTLWGPYQIRPPRPSKAAAGAKVAAEQAKADKQAAEAKTKAAEAPVNTPRRAAVDQVVV